MDDEKKGVEYAKLFTEKGYDNLYLLSGGYESFVEQFPELVEGKVKPGIIKPLRSTGTKELTKTKTKTKTKKPDICIKI